MPIIIIIIIVIIIYLFIYFIQRFSWFSKSRVTDQTLLIHDSAKNVRTIRQVQTVSAFFIIIIIILVTCIQGIYNYIPQTNHVSAVHSVAALLYLQSVPHVMLFRP